MSELRPEEINNFLGDNLEDGDFLLHELQNINNGDSDKGPEEIERDQRESMPDIEFMREMGIIVFAVQKYP